MPSWTRKAIADCQNQVVHLGDSARGCGIAVELL